MSGPKNPLVWKRGIRRGIKTLLRERGWFATLGAIVGVLLLAQILIVVALGVRGTQNLLRSRADVRVELKDTVTDQDVQAFFAAARALPSVSEAVYITKEKAYEEEKARDPELISFLEEFKLENPFRDTVAVTLRSLSGYDAFAAFVKDARWSAIIDPSFLSDASDQEGQIREFIRMTHAGTLLIGVFLGLIGLVVLFVLVELVRRRALARSEEILVERLVGADQTFVLLPFVTEAFFLFLVALILSILLMLAFLQVLPAFIPSLLEGQAFGELRIHVVALLRVWLVPLFLLQLILAPLFAFLGAFLGMRSQLKTPKLSLAAC